jgi:hypothetical protein
MARPSEMGISSATIALHSADGHELSAYRAEPAAPPVGGLAAADPAGHAVSSEPFDRLRSA